MIQYVNRYKVGWSPLRLPSLLAWYDGADEASISATSNDVTQWNDKSGNDNHLTQTLGFLNPKTGTRTVNDLNVVDFDGNNDYLSRSDALGLTGNPSLYLIAVLKVDSLPATAGEGRFAHIGDAGGSNGGKVINFASDGSYRYNNGNQVFENMSTAAAQLHIFQRSSGAQYQEGEYWKNNAAKTQTSAASGTNTPALENEELVLGSGYDGTGSRNKLEYDGAICELMIGNDILSSTDRAAVWAYAQQKWSLL